MDNSIERKAMKEIGMRVDNYRDLITELYFRIEDLKKQIPKEGHWARDGKGWLFCDQCGRRPLSNVIGETKLSNYCPHCGANMKGEQNGQK